MITKNEVEHKQFLSLSIFRRYLKFLQITSMALFIVNIKYYKTLSFLLVEKNESCCHQVAPRFNNF